MTYYHSMTKSSHLSLVSNNMEVDRLRQVLDQLSTAVWSHSSLEQAQNGRRELLAMRLKINGSHHVIEGIKCRLEWCISEKSDDTAIESRAELLKSTIVSVLKDKWAIVKTSALKSELPKIREYYGIASRAWGIENEFLVQSTDELSSTIDANLREAYIEIGSIVRRTALKVFTREELEFILQDMGLNIDDETLTKLMLFEINNTSRINPMVLVLPSAHAPHNPCICFIEYDEVYSELRTLLQMFSFLDEF